MQIVVELPDEYYEALRNSSHVYLMMGGRGNGKTLVSTILVAVANGTPLPKGYGRLIDADALVKTFKEDKAFYVNSWGGFECMPKSDKIRCDEIDMCVSDVINAPTIVEADKE